MSTFAWIDHSEKQRRQIQEAIDLFREKDTRDELGLAGIRDTFSDMLFPGTGALQTRARYFFFVPWMYLEFDAKGVSSAEVARKGRAFEIALIEPLVGAADSAGAIGKLARASLQRLPSNVYWNGLRELGICLFPGSQAQYHRAVDRLFDAGTKVRRNDDKEIVGGAARAWHAGQPSAPGGFPNKATFELTGPEARYLKGRVIETHRNSLFAFLLDKGYQDAEAAFAWEHPEAQDLPDHLRREVGHARCFSELMHGAAILYNLYLGDLEPRKAALIEACGAMFSEWLAFIEQRRQPLLNWYENRHDFWALLASRGYVPSAPTRGFVDEWCTRTLTGDPAGFAGSDPIRDLIFRREEQVKGPMARCRNKEMRWRWNGASGLGRHDFRWSSARTLLQDIADGLEADHA